MGNLSKLKVKLNEGIPILDPELSGAELYAKALTPIRDKVDRPPICIGMGLDDMEYNGRRYPLRFGTFGNISLIKGHEKTRKSFAKSLMLASILGGNANNYSDTIVGHGLKDKMIYDIDTEQGEYEVWLNANRIPRMVGAFPDNYKSMQLRTLTIKERMQLLEWLFMESPDRDNLGVVFLDGYVDFVEDFNSLQQSIAFTQRLMAFSTMAHCHISGILHLNPNSEKGRGHLGTVLQQKCETVAMIEDAGKYSLFKCQRARGKRFEEFAFGVDKDWLPYEMEMNQQTIAI